MKTKINDLLTAVKNAVESLKEDSATPEFTPQLGTALGGLRTAQEGLSAHLALPKPADPATK
jgi:hypothetical protein